MLRFCPINAGEMLVVCLKYLLVFICVYDERRKTHENQIWLQVASFEIHMHWIIFKHHKWDQSMFPIFKNKSGDHSQAGIYQMSINSTLLLILNTLLLLIITPSWQNMNSQPLITNNNTLLLPIITPSYHR